ncbi:PREDICTED: beta-1,3-galactosyltransferase 5-like [Priapulus caudatus]|uniref:Hexosyltransferase n=1 Tax=Priapulus caudatus TaxID=37621 RepID=A0ABM1E1V2_PRICU|nr:PREDICTED: beta-1,3-galactosyltransferase 5-like [Priapulus caudatus]
MPNLLHSFSRSADTVMIASPTHPPLCHCCTAAQTRVNSKRTLAIVFATLATMTLATLLRYNLRPYAHALLPLTKYNSSFAVGVYRGSVAGDDVASADVRRFRISSSCVGDAACRDANRSESDDATLAARFVTHFDADRVAIVDSSACQRRRRRINVVVVVFSVAQNVQRRLAIRRTWAAPSRMTQAGVCVVFLVGKTDAASDDATLTHEAATHGDVVRVDVDEGYYNITHKAVLMLRWATHNCSGALYVMKTDDDSYVNVRRLSSELRAHPADRPLLLGHLLARGRPNREPGSKFYMPYSMYAPEETPEFLSGSGYVMSMGVARALYAQAQLRPLVWFEDVYVTGLCAEGAGIARTDSRLFRTFDKRARTEFGNVRAATERKAICLYRDSVVVHRVTPEELNFLWDKLEDARYEC